MTLESISLDALQPDVRLSGYWRPKEAFWHHYCVPGHHLLLMDEGWIEARTPTSRFRAGPGDLVSFRAADHNEYGYTGAVALYQIHVLFAPPPRHRLPLSLGPLGLLPERLPLGDRAPRARRCFETMCLDLGGPRLEQKARVQAALWELLGLACGALEATPAHNPEIDPWERARARIAADPGTPIDLRALAEEFDLSLAHFTRRFRQRFGVSPVRWRTHEILRHAAERLVAEPDLPVKTLARQLGFTDDWSFTRAFRRHFGLLPTQVRAGSALAPAVPDAGEDPLLRTDRHIVPAGSPENWMNEYQPR